MFDITFNTKRPYTAKGQIIHAVHQIDGSVLFADHSRGIDGHIGVNQCPTRFISKDDFKRFVLDCYDHGQYESNQVSWRLLMMNSCPQVNS